MPFEITMTYDVGPHMKMKDPDVDKNWKKLYLIQSQSLTLPMIMINK